MAKSLRAFPAEVSFSDCRGEEGGGGFGKCAIPLGGSVHHHGRSWEGQGEANRLDGKKPVMLTKKMLAVSVQNSSLWG